NSPQTELFDKSATLYALDRAKKGIRSMDRAIVVEGYMDAIMAHQHGVTNAVCSMGTSLTERQVEQIKKLTTNLVLALDPDTAGDIAAGRGVEIGEQTFDQELVPVPLVSGLVRLERRLKADIRVMELPRGKDPDEVIHESLGEWQRLVDQALPLLDYKFQRILDKHNLAEAKGIAEAVAELGTELAMVPDRIQQKYYADKLAERLSRLAGPLQFRVTDLHEAVARARRKQQSAARRQGAETRGQGMGEEGQRTEASPRDEGTGGGDRGTEGGGPQPPAPDASTAVRMRLDAEDYLVMRALRYLDAADLWRKNLKAEEIVKSANREILEYLSAHLSDGPAAELDHCPDDLPEALFHHLELLRTLA
ncbi:MAG: toprim domain-containing protein, partial [Chloroflexota bacterium]|nr:toprim domain-containing protein [Chloroflexota bacterium]